MVIYLIGSRGSGKTTVGHLLAAQLEYPLIDLDQFLSEQTGETIGAIVTRDGWAAFRKLESQYLRKACASADGGNLVVATGGGVAMEANNRAFMRASGRVIWLNATCETILERLTANPLESQRPSLTGRPLEEETREIVASREPIYRECCHLEVNANNPPEEVCEMVLQSLKAEIASKQDSVANKKLQPPLKS